MKQLKSFRELNPEEIHKVLCSYLQEQYPESGVLSGEEILEDIGVDSFGLIELIVFLEKEFEATYPLEVLTKENTSTIKSFAFAAASR